MHVFAKMRDRNRQWFYSSASREPRILCFVSRLGRCVVVGSRISPRCLLLLADFSSSLVPLRSFLPLSRTFVVGFVAVGYYTDRY